MFNKKNILITGGTGSFGKKFVEIVLNKFKPSKLIIFLEMNLNNIKCKKNLMKKNTLA